MSDELLYSLLELGHATSENLGFAHQPHVHVSYGEETITESNLLELRRRHAPSITLSTFSKAVESRVGADWEWWIIGSIYTLRMRVQAKRVQKNAAVKISHFIKSTGAEQIDILIKDAAAKNYKPVYCFYSSEIQRQIWRVNPQTSPNRAFQTGCLLASARCVKSVQPKKFSQIEDRCVPWHYLASRSPFKRCIINRAASDNKN